MKRTWTGTAAAAALATAFAIPVAFAQDTQQGKQSPVREESGQHHETGQGQMRERTGQPGAQAQTEQPRMGAEPAQGQNPREREGAGKPGMKGESAQTQEPNRMQPGNRVEGRTGSQAEERQRGAQAQERRDQAENPARAEQSGRTADQNRMGQAQNRQNAQMGQNGTTGGNVRTSGRTNIPQAQAAQVAQTLRGAGNVPRANIDVNQVSIGAALPSEVVLDPLPPTIVDLVPDFRGYDYFVIGDEVVFVDPATRQVVEIIEDVG